MSRLCYQGILVAYLQGDRNGPKCRLVIFEVGGAGRRKRPKVSPEGSDERCPATKKGKIVPEGSDERCWATKKGKIVAWGLRCEVSGDDKGQKCCRGGMVERHSE